GPAGRGEAARDTRSKIRGPADNPPRPPRVGVAALLSRVDQLLQALAHLEEGHPLLGHAHRGAGLRIAATAGVAAPHPEAPEPAELDLLDSGQRGGDAVEDR